MTDTMMFIAGQSIIIIGAILVSYIRTSIKLAVLETNTDTLKGAHGRLSIKVEGISRAVSHIEGALSK